MDVLFVEVLSKPLWTWLAFVTAVGLLLAFDLGVLHRKSHAIGVRESLGLSAFYIAVGLGFGGIIFWWMGGQAATEYLTGFVVEKSLAMDNIFVIAMIFSYFAIPPSYQHRVLVYGIIGVLILRGLMIAAGSAIVTEFSWVLYVFAAFLVLTGIKMLFTADKKHDVAASPVVQFMTKRMNMTKELHGEKFFVRQPDATGRLRLFATPLFAALVMVELADLIFAVDSIPAIFAITTDPYIVLTSNVFAILGLRALYFALAAMVDRFVYLKYALAAVLIFIGSKIFIADMLGLAKIPPMVSLSVTLGILAIGILGSLWKTRRVAIDAQ
jgi:tellurite resistance protein TerC